jgi:hypothetical protein
MNISNLHSYLTKLDIIKDAYHTSVYNIKSNSGNILFSNTYKYLFKEEFNTSSYKQYLNEIYNNIDKITEDIQKFYISQLYNHNKSVIRLINIVLSSNGFINVNKQIKLNKKIVSFLTIITKLIEEHTKIHIKELSKLDIQYMNFIEYRDKVNKYIANHLFTFNVGEPIVLNNTVNSVFTDILDNLITKYGNNIGESINNLYTTTQNGGGEEYIPIEYEYENDSPEKEYDYTLKYSEEELDEAPVHIKLCNRIYMILQERHPDHSKYILKYTTNNIFNQLYYYFNRIGETMTDHKFISNMIDKFEYDNFKSFKYDDFEDLYYNRKYELTGDERPEKRLDVMLNIEKQLEEIRRRVKEDPEYREYYDDYTYYGTFEDWKARSVAKAESEKIKTPKSILVAGSGRKAFKGKKGTRRRHKRKTIRK